MDYAEEVIALGDGRRLEVAALGDPQDPTVFFHHGSPGATRFVRENVPLLEHAGLYFVTVSRAGYGLSDRLEGRDVAACVSDVHAALDHFGRSRYVAYGHSGGGPHALACAALDAGRCTGALSLAGVAPYGDDFDWTEGMAPENVEEFRLALEGGPAYLEMLEAMTPLFLAATPETVVDLFGELLPPADRDALVGDEARAVFTDSLVHGFARGYWGFYDDDQAFLRPWGLDLAAIALPVSIWYGGRDTMVPARHGEWLGAHIATATAHFDPGEGHVSILPANAAAIAADLVGLAR
jgi:pimeloyl-ACP methyl ester carboxylesterase